MAIFKSTQENVNTPIQQIHTVLSDFSLLEKHIQKLNHEKADKLRFEAGRCFIHLKQTGEIKLTMVEAEKPYQIKFISDASSPVSFILYFDLITSDIDQTQIQIVLDSQLNTFMAHLAKKPIENFLQETVQILKEIDYKSDN